MHEITLGRLNMEEACQQGDAVSRRPCAWLDGGVLGAHERGIGVLCDMNEGDRGPRLPKLGILGCFETSEHRKGGRFVALRHDKSQWLMNWRQLNVAPPARPVGAIGAEKSTAAPEYKSGKPI